MIPSAGPRLMIAVASSVGLGSVKSGWLNSSWHSSMAITIGRKPLCVRATAPA